VISANKSVNVQKMGNILESERISHMFNDKMFQNGENWYRMSRSWHMQVWNQNTSQLRKLYSELIETKVLVYRKKHSVCIKIIIQYKDFKVYWALVV